MHSSMCIQNYDILQYIISYLDSKDLISIELLSKLWLRCAKHQYKYLGESPSNINIESYISLALILFLILF